MKKHKHIFVVPAYGEPRYLEALLHSLRKQSVPSKILITTSTPTPKIMEVAGKFQLSVFCREGSPCLKDDWNYAYEKGRERAELVTIAHQDDFYYPEYAETVLKAWKQYPDMSLFCCGYDTINEGGKKIFRRQEMIKKMLRLPLRLINRADKSVIKRSALIFGNSIGCPTCTYMTALCGDTLFRDDYNFVIDWAMLLRLADEKGRFVLIEKPLMAYRVHNEQETMRQIENHGRTDEEMAIFEKLHGKSGAKLIMSFYKNADSRSEKNSKVQAGNGTNWAPISGGIRSKNEK